MAGSPIYTLTQKSYTLIHEINTLTKKAFYNPICLSIFGGMDKKDLGKGNIYDRLVKSHIKVILNQVMRKHFGFEAKLEKRLTEKIQKSREREVDYAAIFKTPEGYTFILHLELQSENDQNMIHRMAEYHSLMTAKYELPIIHYVVYIGRAKFNMQTELPKPLQFTGFHVFNYQDYDPEIFLQAERPEEVMQAILCNYKNPDKLLEQIIHRMFELSSFKNEKVQYLHELRIYTKLRKLEELFIKKVQTMPITFDENLEEDIYYQKGIKQGIEKGIEKNQAQTVLAMLKEKFPIKTICKIVLVSETFVLDIKQKNKL